MLILDVILRFNTILCHKVSKFIAEITELIFFEKLLVNVDVEALKQNKNQTREISCNFSYHCSHSGPV